MRQRIIAGNWKMNTTFAEGVELAKEVAALKASLAKDVVVILAPPFTHLPEVHRVTKDSGIAVAAQNCAAQPSGAFTGEVSAGMIASCGATYVILGHSERREYFGEDSQVLRRKISEAFALGLKPIFCVGETLAQREAGKQEEVVAKQLEEVVCDLPETQFKQLIVAYEPVWAIGTGKTATTDQAQQMHRFIRSVLEKKYGEVLAQGTPILYGGSLKPANAQELLGKADVDGGLIGGASLDAKDFIAIGAAFEQVGL